MKSARHSILVVALSALLLGSALDHDAFAQENWATQRATELCAQGDAHRDAGQVDIAIERYRQALEIDPTYGPAYLALGRLREATGDADEAARTYGAGIEHVTGFSEGYLARGTLLLRADKGDAALSDLGAAVALEPTKIPLVKRLLDASISLGKLPMALATARRLVSLAVEQSDSTTEHEGRITVSALVEIVGFVDPVAEGAMRNAPRRALAAAPGGSAPHGKRAKTSTKSAVSAMHGSMPIPAEHRPPSGAAK